MDAESDEIREVYAHFGLAIYLAQLVEQSLVNLMIASRLPRRLTITRGEIEALEGRLYERTLGRLIDELRRDIAVSEALDRDLRRALDTRNRLAHGYFRERIGELTTPAGRVQLIEELDGACALFEGADRTLTETYTPLLWTHGISEETVRAEMDRLLGTE